MFSGFLLCQTVPSAMLKIFDASDNMLAECLRLRIINFAFLIAPFCIISSGTFQALGKGTLGVL